MPYEVFLGRTPEKVYSKLTAKLRKAALKGIAEHIEIYELVQAQRVQPLTPCMTSLPRWV